MTTKAEQGDEMIPAGKTLIDYEEAVEILSSEDVFRCVSKVLVSLSDSVPPW